jgi:hypothetical protein
VKEIIKERDFPLFCWRPRRDSNTRPFAPQ